MMSEAHSIYIETYGCQMNLNDTQIVQRILLEAGFNIANSIDSADVIFLNTCSVRDNAEERIHNRIETIFHLLKKRKNKNILGILGCMAERLQEQLLTSNQIVSLVVGPDEYRKLPNLISLAFKGEKELAVDLTKAETYNDVIPYRTNGISAWISIMRGCNNFCSYCVVPYTRGRERSRPMETILNEIKMLANSNCKDITLLGQNVNSYSYLDKNMNKERTIDFPTLLENVALTHPNIRIRFLTSHPRNLSKELVDIIAGYDNICNSIHLPVQSGSNNVLKLMNRKYSVEHYLELIDMIKSKIPNCALSTDIIAGYPDETLDDHKATLNLMKKVRYHNAFMFRYSPREGTKAFGCVDNIPEEEKIRRLNEIIELQNKISLEENQKLIGTSIEILVEKQSKKNQNEWLGRTKTSNLVVFENNLESDAGDLLNVKIEKATSATLFGKIIVD